MKNTYLVDSSIYIFRGWFVMPDTLQGEDGWPVNALTGFADFVLEFLSATRPVHLAFAFDESLGSCVRRDIYPAYKANRPPAPEELKRQFGLCRELISALGIVGMASARYEADDIIGTLAALERARGQTIHILTGDKDLTQLIADGDSWWDYARQRRWRAREIEKNWGVTPSQIADLLAIAGDKVDNIPGVPGVGVATAAKLLRKFGSVENLLENIAEIGLMKARGAKRLQELVDEHQDTIRLARRLSGIFEEMPLPAWRGSLLRQAPDEARLMALLSRCGFDSARLDQWLALVETPMPTTSADSA